MGLLLLLKDQYAQSWLPALQRELPNTKIEIYPKVEDLEAVEFVVTWRPTKVDIQRLPNVKVLQSLGAGVNYILEADVLREDMVLTRMVDPYLTRDMFEFVLAGVLTHMKRFPEYRVQQEKHLWKIRSYKRISDTCIAVLGLGKIGGYVAEELAQLGFKVHGWSSSSKKLTGVSNYLGKQALSACLAGADFLVNILPLTPATTHILNRATLQFLPKGAFLINVGRGLHNHQEDILALLEEGHLSGALLDVFSEEPLPSQHPFWEHPKVVITPHIASVTNPQSAARQIAENYKRYRAGLPLKDIVSLEKGY